MKVRTKIAALTAAAAVIGATGVGFAWWTQGGSGTGSSTTGDVIDVTVNQLAGATDLYPGGPAQTLSGDFDNPNDGKVYVDHVSVVVDPDWSAQADLDKPECTAADFTIGGSADVQVEIDAGNGVGAWTGLTIAMDDEASNQDNCKNVTVDLVYTAHAAPEPAPEP